MFGENCFKGKTMKADRLLSYGFKMIDGRYVYKTTIMDGAFDFMVCFDEKGTLSTKMWERELDEEYVLYKVENASGNFVGEVREASEAVLKDIAANCFIVEAFKGEQAHMIVEYIKRTYGDDPEFLWEKYPDFGIWRVKSNSKWYGLIMPVSKRKFGIDSDEVVEVMNLTAAIEDIPNIVDNKTFFPTYHMSKKSWFSAFLDGSAPIQRIFALIDKSREITAKKHK